MRHNKPPTPERSVIWAWLEVTPLCSNRGRLSLNSCRRDTAVPHQKYRSTLWGLRARIGSKLSVGHCKSVDGRLPSPGARPSLRTKCSCSCMAILFIDIGLHRMSSSTTRSTAATGQKNHASRIDSDESRHIGLDNREVSCVHVHSMLLVHLGGVMLQNQEESSHNQTNVVFWAPISLRQVILATISGFFLPNRPKAVVMLLRPAMLWLGDFDIFWTISTTRLEVLVCT